MSASSEQLRAQLEAQVRRRARPVLLVVASEGAEALALKNGLTAADLVRPFASLSGLAIPFRVAERGLLTLTEFGMRVAAPAELGFPALEALEASLARAAPRRRPRRAPEACRSRPTAACRAAAAPSACAS